jgi:hypothetical protein
MKNVSQIHTVKRIALYLPNLESGGAERVTLNLAQAFVKHGYQVDLLLVRGEGEFLDQVPPDIQLVDLEA